MIKIRDYDRTDWKAICAIHDAARPDELRGSCDPRAFVPILEDSEVEGLKRSKKFVAVEGSEVLGFVGVDGSQVAWLYVRPDHYRRGIGRQLLRKGLDQIGPGATTIVLHGNQSALQLYLSEGFHEESRYESNNAGYPCICIRLVT